MIDISHYQDQVADWAAVKRAGIVAVVHKATEGGDWTDNNYERRRREVKEAGLLWGAYHFAGKSADGTMQAQHFLDFAKPEDNDLIAFDCERHGVFKQMEDFCVEIHRQLDRWPVIYGRHRLRLVMKGNGSSPVTKGALWFDEYPPSTFSEPYSAMPEGWDDWTIWQYTEGQHGPEPRATPGFGNVDRNTFKGTTEDFLAAWPFKER
jgi:lysozyme